VIERAAGAADDGTFWPVRGCAAVAMCCAGSAMVAGSSWSGKASRGWIAPGFSATAGGDADVCKIGAGSGTLWRA
jgi:hypothetical protein